MKEHTRENAAGWALVKETGCTRYYVNRRGKCMTENSKTGETRVFDGYYNEYTGYMQFAGGLVHRLVAKAFLPNDEGLEQVHHRNSRPRDNRLENLAWTTRAENNSTAASRRRRRISARSTPRKDQIIKATRFDGAVKYFKTGYECAQELGCSHVLVYNALNRKVSARRAKGWSLKWMRLQDIV